MAQDPSRKEAARLAALERYAIFDTPREGRFDDIAALASEICAAPIAVVNLIGKDRQWFKAEVGLGVRETPLETSFCQHAILEEDFLLIPDATQDARVASNPLVTGEPGLRFYAGALLKTSQGVPIGTLCVLDFQPRTLDEGQQHALRRLADQTMALLDLRLALQAQTDINDELERRVEEKAQARSRTWELTPDLMGVLNDSGVFEASNPAWMTMLGLSEQTVSTTSIFKLMHPDDVAAALVAFEEVKRGEPVLHFENRYLHTDGSYRWLSWVVIPEGGKYYAIAREITKDKERASDLVAVTADRDRLWQASPDLLVVADAQGRLEAINPAWTTVLGWNEQELVGQPFTDFTHPEDLERALDAFAGVLKAPLTVPFEFRLRHKDGAYRWIAWTGSFRDGKVYASGRDMTFQREQAAALEEAEDALRQSQKLEAIGQLTGGVAHDFNNLLTIIRGSVDLLGRPTLSDERRTRYVEAISSTVDRAAKLTAQLLAFARRQSLKPVAFDASKAVHGLRDMLATLTGSRIAIETSLENGICCVRADASQFDTALVNLAVNARDAMESEGRLGISVRRVSHVPAIRTHPPIDGDYIAVAVSDSGCGMDSDTLKRIFEPFFTTKGVGQGTGLGLSQVFGFVKQSGGEVDVQSAPRGGSTFTIYLPRIEDAACAMETDAADFLPAELINDSGRCVLIVEDNAEVGAFAVQTLSEVGFDAVLVESGADALDLLAEDNERFDVVFSDVVMPGISGIELGEKIRGLYPDLPVVLASGYSHVLAQNENHGFELLQKPYSIEQLARVLATVAPRKNKTKQ